MRSENPNKFDGQKLGWSIFEGAMAILYLVFAFIFLFPSLLHLRLAVQDGLRIMFGIILGVYGIFRIFRVIKKMR
ncbi:MAG: hypothetical protein FWF52_10720 [Candidatus Azobacteroides sp.]|nr:hypothetical protein [Candidatus Azobacteroides sp.]